MGESLSGYLGMNWEQSAWPWMSPLSGPNVKWAILNVFYIFLVGGFSLMITVSIVSWIFSVQGD